MPRLRAVAINAIGGKKRQHNAFLPAKRVYAKTCDTDPLARGTADAGPPRHPATPGGAINAIGGKKRQHTTFLPANRVYQRPPPLVRGLGRNNPAAPLARGRTGRARRTPSHPRDGTAPHPAPPRLRAARGLPAEGDGTNVAA